MSEKVTAVTDDSGNVKVFRSRDKKRRLAYPLTPMEKDSLGGFIERRSDRVLVYPHKLREVEVE